LLSYDHGYSQSGLISEDIFKKVLHNFSEVMKNHFESKLQSHPLLLFADNLRCHCTKGVLELAEKLHIHLNMFAPNSSHFLAPLDNEMFARFKAELEKRYYELLDSSSITKTRHPAPLCAVIADSFSVAFAPSIVIRSYANVGVWPFRPDIILENASKKTICRNLKKVKSVSPVKTEVIKATVKAHEKAVKNLQASIDKFETIKVLAPKAVTPRKYTAVANFEKTKGRFEELLLLERERDQDKGGKKDVSEGKKRKSQEDHPEQKRDKRRRVENVCQDIDANERAQSENKEAEKKILCSIPNCPEILDKETISFHGWYLCVCTKFSCCQIHEKTESGHQAIISHIRVCSARGKNI